MFMPPGDCHQYLMLHASKIPTAISVRWFITKVTCEENCMENYA